MKRTCARCKKELTAKVLRTDRNKRSAREHAFGVCSWLFIEIIRDAHTIMFFLAGNIFHRINYAKESSDRCTRSITPHYLPGNRTKEDFSS